MSASFILRVEFILGCVNPDSVSGVSMASHWLNEFFDSKDFADLIGNIRDPEQIVRIASQRALVRILAMQRGRSTERVLRRLEMEIDGHERDQILGVSFLPRNPFVKESAEDS